MIVRILTLGQWDVPDDRMDGLNVLDAEVESAVDAGDTATFATSLGALLQAVRDAGEPLPDDALTHSALILPPPDATIEEVRELLGEDGLIPG